MRNDLALLRERRAQHVRVALLDSVIVERENEAADHVSMAEVAHSAWISLRTPYRYFPDGSALLTAAR